MGGVNQGKVICTHCQAELTDFKKKCQCRRQCESCKGHYIAHFKMKKVSARQQRTVYSLCLLIGSCISISLPIWFWFSVILDFKMYSLTYEHPFEKFAFIFAAWSFFIGCYCIVITLPEILSYRNITLVKHRLLNKRNQKQHLSN